tara:strand:+ start:1939 stop:2661 length:723 start_codon:yes stop_codon:yes gene_type:complete
MARRKTKRLLSEGEMRRFAKLAKISPVNEMYGKAMPGARDEDEDEPGMRDYMEEGAHEDEEEPGMRDDMQEAAHEGGEEMEVSADEMEMDMDDMDDKMDMDMPAADAGEGMVDIEDFMNALESALEEVTGEEVSTDIDMGDEMAPKEGGDALDMEMPEEPEMDMPDMDELAEAIARRVRRRMNENRRPAKRTRSKAETVNAVTERVMKRINEEKKQAESLDKRADALTDRIFARLMKESR